MKKSGLILFAAFITAGTIISSCKKDKAPTPVNPPAKTCVVSKDYYASGKLQDEFIYAGDKLSSIKSHDEAGMNDSSTIVSYDASGNVVKVDNTDTKGNITNSLTYDYNPSGTLAKVHAIQGGQEQATLSFDYNGTIAKKPNRMHINVPGFPVELAYVDYTYDANTNVTQSVTYTIDPSTMQYSKSTTDDYLYDNMKNPMMFMANILVDPTRGGPNNILKDTQTDHTNNNAQTVTTYSYDYTTEGYPSKTTTTDSSSTTVTTIEYNCK